MRSSLKMAVGCCWSRRPVPGAGGQRGGGTGSCLFVAPPSLQPGLDRIPHVYGAQFLVNEVRGGREPCEPGWENQAHQCYRAALCLTSPLTLTDWRLWSFWIPQEKKKKNTAAEYVKTYIFVKRGKKSFLFQTNDLCSRISITSTYMKMYLHRQTGSVCV